MSISSNRNEGKIKRFTEEDCQEKGKEVLLASF
jgi:hypothetical protein